MGASLFGRTYEVSIGPPGEEGRRLIGPADGSGLQCAFEVERTSKRRSDKATVNLTNLSVGLVGFIEQEGNAITLMAGYKANASLIFTGAIKRVTTTHEGTDRVTTIEARAADLATTSARLDKGYTAGTPLLTVLGACASAMGLGRGTLDRLVDPSLKLSAGTAFFGPASVAVDKAVAQLGAGWSWSAQDGQLVVLGPSDTLEDTATLLTPTSGLVGAPQRQKRRVELTSLMQPRIKPGGFIEVQSKTLTGFWRAQTVRHVGDYRGGDWYTRAECKEI